MMPLALSQAPSLVENMEDEEEDFEGKKENVVKSTKRSLSISPVVIIGAFTMMGMFGWMMMSSLWNHADKSNMRDELEEIKNELLDVQTKLRKDELELQDMNWTLSQQYNMTEQVFNHTKLDLRTVHAVVQTQSNLMAYQFAGTFAMIASLISIWHMSNHLRNYNEPLIQKKIIAILWMVPVYSITSWLTLVTALEYFSVVKDFYESFIIYTFLSFLIAVLGRGNRSVVIDTLARNHTHFQPPFSLPPCCCGGMSSQRRQQLEEQREHFQTHPHDKAEAVLYQCQVFTMQFVFLRPLTSVAMTLCNAFLGKRSKWDPFYPQFYIFIIENISVAMAFSGLVRFYHAVQSELKWCRAFAKFLCIKGIVFMTFWQGVLITIFAKTVVHINNDDHHPSTSSMEWSVQAQSFLICLEMLFFAIIHGFVFNTEEWTHGYQPSMRPKLLKESIGFEDFKKDLKFLLQGRNQQSMKDDIDLSDDPMIISQRSPTDKEHQEDNVTDKENDTKLSSNTRKQRPGRYYIVYKPDNDEDYVEGEEILFSEQYQIINSDGSSPSFEEYSSQLPQSIQLNGNNFCIDDDNDYDIGHDSNNEYKTIDGTKMQPIV